LDCDDLWSDTELLSCSSRTAAATSLWTLTQPIIYKALQLPLIFFVSKLKRILAQLPYTCIISLLKHCCTQLLRIFSYATTRAYNDK
jgi:hypothetical protein